MSNVTEKSAESGDRVLPFSPFFWVSVFFERAARTKQKDQISDLRQFLGRSSTKFVVFSWKRRVFGSWFYRKKNVFFLKFDFFFSKFLKTRILQYLSLRDISRGFQEKKLQILFYVKIKIEKHSIFQEHFAEILTKFVQFSIFFFLKNRQIWCENDKFWRKILYFRII